MLVIIESISGFYGVFIYFGGDVLDEITIFENSGGRIWIGLYETSLLVDYSSSLEYLFIFETSM